VRRDEISESETFDAADGANHIARGALAAFLLLPQMSN